MSDFNSLGLSGRITRDAELRFIPSGTPICEFGFASNEKFGDKETTLFIDCKIWGKKAESLSQYLTKGKSLILSGKLELETWETDGQKRSKHTFKVLDVTFTPGQKEDSKPTTSNVKEEDIPSTQDEDSEIPF